MSSSSFQSLFIVLLGWSVLRQLPLEWMFWESQCVNCSHFFFPENWKLEEYSLKMLRLNWILYKKIISWTFALFLCKLPYLKDAQAKWKVRFDWSVCMCVMFCMNFRDRKNLILSESNTIKNSCEVRVATGLPLIQPLDLQTLVEVQTISISSYCTWNAAHSVVCF